MLQVQNKNLTRSFKWKTYIYLIFFLNSNLDYILNSHWKQNLYNKAAVRLIFRKPMSILGVTKSNEILFYFEFYFSLYPRATLGISARNPYMPTKKNELIEVLFTPNLDEHPLLDPVDADPAWIRIKRKRIRISGN